MRFEPPLIEGSLLRRYRRFLADVRLTDGSRVTAHCPNPGSMRSCLVPGGRVWLSRQPAASRKLGFTWELAQVGKAKVLVHPVRANQLVLEALRSARIPELSCYSQIEQEVQFGSNTRFDFCLTRGSQRCFVEVKSVTYTLGNGRLAFPDSPTERGRKHLLALMESHRRGHRAVLLFCASRNDARCVVPADEVDPEYGRLLRRAQERGVELVSYRVSLRALDLRLNQRIPVLLPQWLAPRPPRARAGQSPRILP